MKHKKNKPEHPLHFSKYNAPLRTRKRGIAFLHVLPSLFFQLEQQPLKPTSLSQGQALLALFLFLRRIKPVSSSGLIPCCPLYLECYPFHMALLVHLHPSDFTLSIPSPETPSLALVSKSTLSSLIWPSHNLPASFCPLPWTQFSIHCLLRLLELSSCLPPPKAAQHLSCWPSHCHLPAPRLHAWVNDWVTFGKVTLQNGVWGSSFFIHWLTGVLRKEPMALQNSLTWQLKARRRTLLLCKALRHVNPGLWTFSSTGTWGSSAGSSAKHLQGCRCPFLCFVSLFTLCFHTFFHCWNEQSCFTST